MRRGIKKTLLLLLKAAFSTGLLIFVLSRVGADNVLKPVGDAEAVPFATTVRAGIDNVLTAVRDTGVVSLAAAVVIFVAMIFLTSIRWGLILGHGTGTLKLFRLQMLGTFFNTFLPGLIGGDAIKIYYMHKKAGIGTEAVASVFMDRYIGYAALMLLGLLSYPFGFGHFSGTWIAWMLPAMVMAFTLGSIMVFGLEFGKKQFDFLSKVYGYFRSYRSRRGIMAKALSIGITVHFLSAILVFTLAMGMGDDIPLLALMVFIPIISTLAALPISVGGIGIREGAMILLLGTLGVEADRATALSFLWYFSMVAGGALGATEYIRGKDYIKEAFHRTQEAGN